MIINMSVLKAPVGGKYERGSCKPVAANKQQCVDQYRAPTTQHNVANEALQKKMQDPKWRARQLALLKKDIKGPSGAERFFRNMLKIADLPFDTKQATAQPERRWAQVTTSRPKTVSVYSSPNSKAVGDKLRYSYSWVVNDPGVGRKPVHSKILKRSTDIYLVIKTKYVQPGYNLCIRWGYKHTDGKMYRACKCSKWFDAKPHWYKLLTSAQARINKKLRLETFDVRGSVATCLLYGRYPNTIFHEYTDYFFPPLAVTPTPRPTRKPSLSTSLAWLRGKMHTYSSVVKKKSNECSKWGHITKTNITTRLTSPTNSCKGVIKIYHKKKEWDKALFRCKTSLYRWESAYKVPFGDIASATCFNITSYGFYSLVLKLRNSSKFTVNEIYTAKPYYSNGWYKPVTRTYTDKDLWIRVQNNSICKRMKNAVDNVAKICRAREAF